MQTVVNTDFPVGVVTGDVVIDWSRVQDLRMEIGADDFDDVVALFLEEADDVVRRLPSLTSARSMESDLHFLKGSALNLGFADLAQICQTGERRAAAGLTDFALDAVVTVYQQSRADFLGGIKTRAA